jgi:hypothetical protein
MTAHFWKLALIAASRICAKGCERTCASILSQPNSGNGFVSIPPPPVAWRYAQGRVVPDIETSAFMQEISDLNDRLSGIRAVQSTPLLSRSSRLLGMISTHCHSACKIVFAGSIIGRTPRLVRTSTISYRSGRIVRCRLANAGVPCQRYAGLFFSAY